MRKTFTTGALALVLCLGSIGCASVSWRLAMNQGVNFFKAKEFEKAADSFKRAITIAPGNAEGHLDLGLTYMELYEPGSEHPKDLEYAEGAISAFKKYLQLDPKSEKGRDYLINVCKLSSRMQDAIDFFIGDYEKNPGDLNKVNMMAALYRMQGNMEKAIEFYEKAAELDASNPESLYSVGVACWGRSYNSMNLDYEARMQLLDKGIAALDKAMQLRKDYYEALIYINLIYRQKAQYDISPAQGVIWRQKADEFQAKAMELRNAQLAAQAAEAAKAAGTSPAGGTPPPAARNE